VDPGFDARDPVTVEVTLPPSRYPTPEARALFFQDVLGRLEAIPGTSREAADRRLILCARIAVRRQRAEGSVAAVILR
jgi:hypothetical protein